METVQLINNFFGHNGVQFSFLLTVKLDIVDSHIRRFLGRIYFLNWVEIVADEIPSI